MNKWTYRFLSVLVVIGLLQFIEHDRTYDYILLAIAIILAGISVRERRR